jgi:hypothetical protein
MLTDAGKYMRCGVKWEFHVENIYTFKAEAKSFASGLLEEFMARHETEVLRIWPISRSQPPSIISLPVPLLLSEGRP